MLTIQIDSIADYKKELYEAQEPLGNIFVGLESFKRFYLKRLYDNALRILLLPLAVLVIIIAMPPLYFYIAKKQRQVSLLIQKLKESIPLLSLDELRELHTILNQVFEKMGITRNELKEISSFPTIIKPFAYSVKETLDSFVELDELIKQEYELSYKLLSDALDAEPNFTLVD